MNKKYEEAIHHYTQAIEMDNKQPAFYSNSTYES